MVGLNPTAGAFFSYLALLICYTTGLKMMFSILAQTLPKKANVLGVGTFLVLLLSLFSGFMVYPNVIPKFYIWLYWMNPMAWALQGLLTNEFMSEKYADLPDGLSGSTFLAIRGFQTGFEWLGYSFAYMIPYTLICTLVLGAVLRKVTIQPEVSIIRKKNVVMGSNDADEKRETNLPFVPVDLTFKSMVYEVKASKGDETLRLLNEVSGVFNAGRMCALMGSSGAGKVRSSLLAPLDVVNLAVLTSFFVNTDDSDGRHCYEKDIGYYHGRDPTQWISPGADVVSALLWLCRAV